MFIATGQSEPLVLLINFLKLFYELWKTIKNIRNSIVECDKNMKNRKTQILSQKNLKTQQQKDNKNFQKNILEPKKRISFMIRSGNHFYYFSTLYFPSIVGNV